MVVIIVRERAVGRRVVKVQDRGREAVEACGAAAGTAGEERPVPRREDVQGVGRPREELWRPLDRPRLVAPGHHHVRQQVVPPGNTVLVTPGHVRWQVLAPRLRVREGGLQQGVPRQRPRVEVVRRPPTSAAVHRTSFSHRNGLSKSVHLGHLPHLIWATIFRLWGRFHALRRRRATPLTHTLSLHLSGFNYLRAKFFLTVDPF